MKFCSVPDCKSLNPRFHIPKANGVRAIWIERILNPDLERIHNEHHGQWSDDFLKFKICNKHFLPMCRQNGPRLRKNALPSLFVEGYTGAADAKNSFFREKSENTLPAIRHIKERIAALEMLPKAQIGSEDFTMTVSKTSRVYGKRKLEHCHIDAPVTDSTKGAETPVVEGASVPLPKICIRHPSELLIDSSGSYDDPTGTRLSSRIKAAELAKSRPRIATCKNNGEPNKAQKRNTARRKVNKQKKSLNERKKQIQSYLNEIISEINTTTEMETFEKLVAPMKAKIQAVKQGFLRLA